MLFLLVQQSIIKAQIKKVIKLKRTNRSIEMYLYLLVFQ